MTFIETIKAETAKHITAGTLSLVWLVLTGTVAISDWLIPTSYVEQLGSYKTARILSVMLLAAIGLAAWIAYLFPWLKPDGRGMFVSRITGQLFCHKCKVVHRRHSPLVTEAAKGWRCRACGDFVFSQDFKEPEKPKRRSNNR